jgi:hypothetical protein
VGANLASLASPLQALIIAAVSGLLAWLVLCP